MAAWHVNFSRYISEQSIRLSVAGPILGRVGKIIHLWKMSSAGVCLARWHERGAQIRVYTIWADKLFNTFAGLGETELDESAMQQLIVLIKLFDPELTDEEIKDSFEAAGGTRSTIGIGAFRQWVYDTYAGIGLEAFQEGMQEMINSRQMAAWATRATQLSGQVASRCEMLVDRFVQKRVTTAQSYGFSCWKSFYISFARENAMSKAVQIYQRQHLISLLKWASSKHFQLQDMGPLVESMKRNFLLQRAKCRTILASMWQMVLSMRCGTQRRVFFYLQEFSRMQYLRASKFGSRCTLLWMQSQNAVQRKAVAQWKSHKEMEMMISELANRTCTFLKDYHSSGNDPSDAISMEVFCALLRAMQLPHSEDYTKTQFTRLQAHAVLQEKASIGDFIPSDLFIPWYCEELSKQTRAASASGDSASEILSSLLQRLTSFVFAKLQEKMELINDLEGERTELKSAVEKGGQEKRVMVSVNTDLQAEKGTLTNEVSELKLVHEKANQKLKSEVSELQMGLKAADAKLQLVTSLHVKESEENTNLVKEVAALMHEVSGLKLAHERAEKKLQLVTSLHDTNSTENKKLLKEVAAQEGLLDEISELKKAVEKEGQKSRLLASLHTELTTEIGSLQKENTSLKEHKERIEREVLLMHQMMPSPKMSVEA